jgi:hypothetical protein
LRCPRCGARAAERGREALVHYTRAVGLYRHYALCQSSGRETSQSFAFDRLLEAGARADVSRLTPRLRRRRSCSARR